MPPPMIENFVVGIFTTVVTAIVVWVWDKIRRSQQLNRRASFFGLAREGSCLAVMNHNPRSPNTMSHRDVEILVDVVSLMNQIGGDLVIAPSDRILEPAGDMTEFCIGGPGSNQRAKVHLENFLQGIWINDYAPESPESLAIATQKDTFRYEKNQNEYAVLARFYPYAEAHPIFLFCGQTSRANQGAAHYLVRHYEKYLRAKFGNRKPFCLVLKLQSPTTYGYKAVKLVKDVTDVAFIPSR
ncbi:MAG: hypothetical protein AAGF01_11060 [Cyanobacteria bacterium P01_G01_bin.38]